MESRALLFTTMTCVLVACAGAGPSPPAPPASPPVVATSPPISGAPTLSPVTPAAGTDQALSPALAEALDRVRGLLAATTRAAIETTFSPAFLTKIPADKVKDLLSELHDQMGTCGATQILKIKSDTAAVVQIQCAHGGLNVALVVKPEPPHLLDGLLLKPAQ
jgi:hypothetical protein